jgi:hypothetical protein
VVEISRLGEAGGGTRKYYRSNTRVFSDDVPAECEESLAEPQATATEELGSLVETLYADHGEEIEAVARAMTPFEYCETQTTRSSSSGSCSTAPSSSRARTARSRRYADARCDTSEPPRFRNIDQAP